MDFSKICIIDDDEIYQFMITKKLRSLSDKIQLQTYSNGKKAVDAFTEENEEDDYPDIILLDINMPVMDGWEFMEFFDDFSANLEKEIAIYIVSSSGNPSDLHKAQEKCNISGYLTKPVNLSMLKFIIEEKPKNHWMLSAS